MGNEVALGEDWKVLDAKKSLLMGAFDVCRFLADIYSVREVYVITVYSIIENIGLI